MDIVVVGLGSMGRRRIRLLQKISDSFHIVGVDSKMERCKQAEEELQIETMQDLDDALRRISPKCVVISTSPLSHAGIIEKCLQAGCNVFTELNLVRDKYASNMQLAKEKGLVLFISSTFLYRKEMEYIENSVHGTSGPVNYSYHVGQYLPDWHPWEKITDYFVGDARTNGCRELFAIELPWIERVFGKITSYQMLKGKNTQLPIQYDDNYLLLIEHEGGNKGMLAVDVVARKAGRNLEIFGENLHMTWNGTPTGLREYDIDRKEEREIELYETVDKREGYASFVIENAYQSELESFLAIVENGGTAKYTFEDDEHTLALIDELEGSVN